MLEELNRGSGASAADDGAASAISGAAGSRGLWTWRLGREKMGKVLSNCDLLKYDFV